MSQRHGSADPNLDQDPQHNVMDPQHWFLITRVADPYSDPDWIRIQSGQWIRIRIRNPDPGGQKLPTKVEEKFKSSCFEVLDGLF
jgi:hypothetical protein